MAKFIEIHTDTHRVRRVVDTLPENTAEASVFASTDDFTFVNGATPDDITTGHDDGTGNPSSKWWWRASDNTLHPEKIYSLADARTKRNEEIGGTDCLYTDDTSPTVTPAIKAAAKVFRQKLRDVCQITGRDIVDSDFPKHDYWEAT